MSEENRTVYNRIVGIRDAEIYMLDDVFRHSDNFHGATGYSFELLLPEQIHNYRDSDYAEYYRELWQQAVQLGDTDDGLDNWAEAAYEEEINDYGAVFPGDWDHSFLNDLSKALSFLENQRPQAWEQLRAWWMEAVGLEDTEEFDDAYAEWTNENDSDAWEILGLFRARSSGRCLSEDLKLDIVLDPEVLEIIKKAEAGN